MDLGSGRPRFWLHDIAVFLESPLDQQLAGIDTSKLDWFGSNETIQGHGDWLELITRTGIIGFLLFASVQVLILRKILGMAGKERYAFLALFTAVNVMMCVSNSYAWRIQVSHLYYIVLAFVEIPLTSMQQASVVDRQFVQGREWVDGRMRY